MNALPVRLDYTPPDNGKLSSLIHLGASSWTHQFWKGQIYHAEYKSEKEFNLNSLKEYAALGLFSLVEIDSSYYKPPEAATLEKYATLVPDNFVFTAKLWERLSIPEFPNMKRYGKVAGQTNASFLNAKVFHEEFLPAFKNPDFYQKFGSFLLQFSPMSNAFATSRSFLVKLEDFLQAFPAEFKLAIELRNSQVLTPAYVAILNKYKVSHCFNSWTAMPDLLTQMKMVASAGGLSAEHFMVRLVTPLNMRYEDAGEYFEPFYTIKKKDEAARRDVVRIASRAIQRNIPAYIIVNNRFEGNTPLTIKELELQIIERTSATVR